MIVTLTEDEVRILGAALDSYLYWQLAEEQHRNDGYVYVPVSEDPEARAEAVLVNALFAKLSGGDSFFSEEDLQELSA